MLAYNIKQHSIHHKITKKGSRDVDENLLRLIYWLDETNKSNLIMPRLARLS